MIATLTCGLGMAILIINSIAPPRYLISRVVAGPEICERVARDFTPFAIRFHFETPLCLIEIPATKGDKR